PGAPYPVAPQAHRVEAVDPGRVPRHQHEGGHVLDDPRTTPYHGESAYPHELVEPREAPDDGPVFHLHEPRQSCPVGQHHVIAHDAVVTDVNVGHNEIPVA